jgi:starch synthase
MRSSLRVCFVTSEFTPLAKTGGLGDVASALARHLHSTGHDIRVFLPGYARLAGRVRERWPVDFLQNLVLDLGPHRYQYAISTARDPGSDLMLYLVDCPALYARPQFYTQDPDEHLRFLLLTRAALEACQRMSFAPQVLHCHDWHAAFGPLYLQSLYRWDRLFATTKSVLTIHNLGYQGVMPAAAAADLGLGADLHLLHQDDLRLGRINALKHGIMYADLITTVSPTYAREICTPQFGMGLDATLRARGDRLVGILNGVDYREWNPEQDRFVPYAFSAADLGGKRRAKHALLTRLNLEPGPATALIGMVSRLVWQKGIDLLYGSLPRVLAERDVCLVALGSGEAAYEEFFETLQRRHPRRVVFHRGYSEELAHWIEAGSDIFLMPSRYEPCGLNQMYSLRYGTVPIVRRTGGLADSVQPWSPESRTGTGILFDHLDGDAVYWALDTALGLYRDRGSWIALMQNGMAQDFSWETQGERYVEAYEALIGVGA